MKKGTKIIAGLAILLVVLYLVLPKYTYKALWYNFTDIDDYRIFHNRTLMASAPKAWPVHTKYGSTKIPADCLDSMMQYKPVAFLIIQDGKLRFEQYFEGYDTTTISGSFSAAKSIVGFAVLKAVELGFIGSLDEPVAKYLTDWNNPANANLTIRNVLTMSSGLDWKESYAGLFNTTTEAYYGTNLWSQIAGLKVTETPGKTWEYKSGNTQLLAFLLEKATGMHLSDFVAKYFWGPLHAQEDALWSLDHAAGIEKAYCCFNAPARDFARFGQMILEGGTFMGDTILAPSLMAEALKPATYLNDEAGKPVDFYGFQIWMMNYKGLDIKYMRGIGGQYIYAIPAKNMVVVRLGHNRDKQKMNHHTIDAYFYVRAALEMVAEGN